MSSKKDESIKCPFCQHQLNNREELPNKVGEELECPGCGALYYCELTEDFRMDEAMTAGMNHFGVKNLECRRLEGCDVLLDYPGQPLVEGMSLDYVFLKPLVN